MNEPAGVKVTRNNTSPQQTQRAHGNNGNGFKKGQPRPPNAGRKKGTPNRFSADIQEALIEAVNRYGCYGDGDEGMVGFIMGSCELERGKVMTMLNSAMPRTINAKLVHTREAMSYAEARERLISRGVNPALLEYLPQTTAEEAEQREIEEMRRAYEAKLAAMANGGPMPTNEDGTIVGGYVEITE